jgi:hypothetical protein
LDQRSSGKTEKRNRRSSQAHHFSNSTTSGLPGVIVAEPDAAPRV